MNQVSLVGNITDDPELRYTQSWRDPRRLTVAVSHRSKQAHWQWQDVKEEPSETTGVGLMRARWLDAHQLQRAMSRSYCAVAYLFAWGKLVPVWIFSGL